jgi:acyl-CoA hydrolase
VGEIDLGAHASISDGPTNPPEVIAPPVVDDVSRAIAEKIVALLPDNAAIQYGPGPIGAACVELLNRPTRIRSGIVSDAVVEAARRGVITGTPVGSYAVGTAPFYAEIADRGWVNRVERTHDHRSLSDDTFFALNTALEIDMAGQVNADFAFSAASSRHGLSIVALPSHRGSTPTLVEKLTENVTTQRSDIDVVVNENGTADLRGLSDRERARSLARLWNL